MGAYATESLLEPFGYGYGFAERIALPQPAAGQPLTFKLDSAYRWRPLSLRFGLTTSATVASRVVTVDYTDPDGVVWIRNGAAVAVTASTTAQGFDFNYQRGQAEWTSVGDVLAPLAAVILEGGLQIRVNVLNIQAADQILTPLLYCEKFVTGPTGYEGGAVRQRDGSAQRLT